MADLVFSNVSFSYNDFYPILTNINLEIVSDEILGILGPNGAGKTTLVKLANGLIRPNSGKIFFNGENIRNKTASQLAKQIVVTFQFIRQQFFTSSVEKELLVTLNLHEKSETTRLKRLESLLDQFQLEKLRNRHPYSLSGGEQRRLAIALALAIPASFYLLDEPTANLDLATLEILTTTILSLKEQKKGLIIASHDIEYQLSLCDRLIIISNGTIQYQGTPLDIINAMKMNKWDFFEIPEIFSFMEIYENKVDQFQLFERYFSYKDLQERISKISDFFGGIVF